MQIKFKGIIFDMDGTLTVPLLDFRRIRKELGAPEGGDLAQLINSWPPERRVRAWATIEKHELQAVENNCLQPDLEPVLKRFTRNRIRLAIITRNTTRSTDALLTKLQVRFFPVLTREFPYIKPAPEPVFHILDAWGIKAEECLMVGDYIHDIQAANAAGVRSCYFKNPDVRHWDEHADFTVNSYRELETLVFGEKRLPEF
ncbi:MAG: HAD family hydrolase [Victivallales bacterium]|nr:HAD family hydrolase [Victivallales bacterium]